jgi:PRTRC genetic system protein B
MSLINAEPMKPICAITIYSNTQTEHIEYHNFDPFTNSFQAGKQLTTKEGVELLGKIIDSQREDMIFSGSIPKGLLHYEAPEKVIFWVPPQKREFLCMDIGIDTDNYPCPGLLYIATETSIDIYAFKGKEYKPGQKLFYAPIPNVNRDGKLCIGTAYSKASSNTFHGLVKRAEDITWKSLFSAIHNEKMTKTTYRILMKKLKGKKIFPELELMPIPQVLQKKINERIK